MSKYRPTNYFRKPKRIKTDVISNYQMTPILNYNAYNLYFKKEKEEQMQSHIKKTQVFESFIHKSSNQFDFKYIWSKKFFIVDLLHLLSDQNFISEWPEFETELKNNFSEVIKCLALAMHNTLEGKLLEETNNTQRILARIRNHQEVTPIKNLRANFYNKLVTAKGTVVKAKSVQIKCRQMEFLCPDCEKSQLVKQADGVYTVPKKCITKGCKKMSNFIPLKRSPFMEGISSQEIIIQEVNSVDSEGDNGRIPRTLKCELIQDLVGSCVPGDEVTVTGVFKIQNYESGSTSSDSSIFVMYLAVNFLRNERNKICSISSFNNQDFSAVKTISEEPNLFRFLIHSLCPKIYGHEMVKAGLILALFGGTKDTKFTRSESHVLIIGDPGLGKSQMLRACSNLSPRGIYVCGNTSTTAGLTVSLSREKGDSILAAGALVLADQGCCCIDEFDKMPQQHAGLLEVMEQQSISIAKAGVSCTVPTRASVLAAANPFDGHYDKSKTVSENIKISGPLLSRFDLVFILFDKSSKELDMLLVEHVLALNKNSQSVLNTSIVDPSNGLLKDRLRLGRHEKLDLLPHVLFRKYIAYAKKYIQPQLNSEAKEILRKFYLDLRKQYHKADSIPMTTRQLESLIRLTQARAKLELRTEATAQDALDVVEIMRNSLVDVFSNETGSLDFSRAPNGGGVSNKKMVSNFLEILDRKSSSLQKKIFNLNELKSFAASAGIPHLKFQNILDSLNVQGYLLMKGNGHYQFIL